MLAFSVIIYRYNQDSPLASWMVDTGGLKWLDELVTRGKAEQGGNGYPLWYCAKAGDVLPLITNGLPEHEGPFVIGEDYVLPGAATWDIEIDTEQIRICDPEQMLQIDAWDMS